MNYCLYGQLWSHVSRERLLAEAREKSDLLARAEESGCEGCYVEVARWSDKRRRWERYCFLKVFGGEHPTEADTDGVPSRVTAEKFAAEVNEAGGGAHASLVHKLPNWEGET